MATVKILSCGSYLSQIQGVEVKKLKMMGATALASGLLFASAVLPGAASQAGMATDCAVAEDTGLQIVVQQIRSSDGLLTVELYDDNPDGFIKKSGRLERVRVDALEGETELCMKAPGPGRYAIVVYHDENGNKKFDRNFLGIPKEGFGFSNNPKFSFGPPSHEESSFDLGEDSMKVEIKVNYL